MLNLTKDMFLPLSDSLPEDGDNCLVLCKGNVPLEGHESCYYAMDLTWDSCRIRDEDTDDGCFVDSEGVPVTGTEKREIIGWVKNDIFLI